VLNALQIKIHLDDTDSEERQLDLRTKFVSDIHYVIRDKFIADLKKQKVVYIEVEEKFEFLTIKNPDRNKINSQIKNVQSVYVN
jgi:hypothetical protein